MMIQSAHATVSPLANLDHKSTNVPSMYITPKNFTPDKYF